MTVETYEPAPVERRVDSWAGMLTDVARLAELIANTDLVPAYLRGNPAGVCAVVLFGREIGLPPMTSLGTLYLVGGRVRMYAEPMAALVLAAGHEIEYREDTSSRAIVAGRRKGGTVWHEVSWTIEQARHAGLSGGSWQKYPRRMLKARAVSELCRDLFPDVLSGIEAVEDADEDTASESRPTRVRRRTSGVVSDATSPAPAVEVPTVTAPDTSAETAEPSPEREPPVPAPGGGSVSVVDVPLPGDDEPGPHVDPADRPYTREQRALMMRLFGQLEITERQDRIDLTGALIGHPVESANDLTVADAGRLIDALTPLVSMGNAREVMDGILRAGGYVVNDPLPLDEPEP